MLLWMLPTWFLFCFVHFNVFIGQRLVSQCLLKYWRKGGVIVAWNSTLCNTSTTQNVGIPAYISPVKCETGCYVWMDCCPSYLWWAVSVNTTVHGCTAAVEVTKWPCRNAHFVLTCLIAWAVPVRPDISRCLVMRWTLVIVWSVIASVHEGIEEP